MTLRNMTLRVKDFHQITGEGFIIIIIFNFIIFLEMEFIQKIKVVYLERHKTVTSLKLS